jgi:hypothetical protein
MLLKDRLEVFLAARPSSQKCGDGSNNPGAKWNEVAAKQEGEAQEPQQIANMGIKKMAR